MTGAEHAPTAEDVRAAAARIAPFVIQTPVVSAPAIDALVGTRVLFKCEHLQHSGSFKYRGATNAVQSLTDAQATAGVATHSSGNHGQALARAARLRSIPCHVVMPANSLTVKLDAVRAHGATVHLCEPTMSAREAGLDELRAATGAVEIHPFTDPRVIAGQGTAVWELLLEHPDVEIVLAPVGGGGLICGSAISAHAHNQATRVVGAEPAGARDAYDSIRSGQRVTHHTPDTICDGLRGTIGAINFTLMMDHDIEVLLVSDAEVVAAIELIRTTLGAIIEPSSATVVAALVRAPDRFAGRVVGAVLSGGNVQDASDRTENM